MDEVFGGTGQVDTTSRSGWGKGVRVWPRFVAIMTEGAKKSVRFVGGNQRDKKGGSCPGEGDWGPQKKVDPKSSTVDAMRLIFSRARKGMRSTRQRVDQK